MIGLLHEKEKRNAAYMIAYNIKYHQNLNLKHISMFMNTWSLYKLNFFTESIQKKVYTNNLYSSMN